jgi:hypothetical protein
MKQNHQWSPQEPSQPKQGKGKICTGQKKQPRENGKKRSEHAKQGDQTFDRSLTAHQGQGEN